MTIQIRHRFTGLLCGFALSIVTGAGFAATNLLTNPSFDRSLAGWTVLNGYTANWSPVDAGGNINSGSALVVNELKSGNESIPLTLAQCVKVTPLTDYSFGGRLMVPAGQPADTNAELWAETYTSSDCGGSPVLTAQDRRGTVGQWVTLGSSLTTLAGIYSIRLTLAAGKPGGVTANASAQFDDLYLQQSSNGNTFVIGPSLSGSWYNPAQSGHGIMLELLSATSAWMCWFTFDLNGNRAWICSLGSVGGVTIDFAQAFTVQGGSFPPLFDPNRIVEVPWGGITVTFAGCDTGTMTWTTTAPGFQSGSMPLHRLTTLWGTACQ